METTLSVSAVFAAFAAVASSTSAIDNPYIQYGALGLCAIMVIFQCKRLSSMSKEHREERKELVASIEKRDERLADVTERCIQSYNRLADVLNDRPCLHRDRRINEQK